MRLAAFALLMCLSVPLRATEVVWAIVDGAPYHLDGAGGPAKTADELGQGITDHLIRGLVARMPRFQHRLLYTSRSRMWKEIAGGQLLCYADAVKTPQRLGWAHFTVVTPPMRQLLVTRAGTLRGTEEQQLAQVLADVSLRGVFVPDRSYGLAMDDLIAAAGAHVRRMAVPASPQLLRMLEAGRMDYVVEYPPAIQHWLERLQPRPALDFHLLAEDRNSAPGHVACTRGAWGLEVIKAVDQAMRDWAQQPEVSQALQRWIPAEILRQELPAIQRFYSERAQRVDLD